MNILTASTNGPFFSRYFKTNGKYQVISIEYLYFTNYFVKLGEHIIMWRNF